MKNVVKLSMFLHHKCHQALTAGCSQGNILTAALLPKQVQSRGLKAKAWTTSNERAHNDLSSFISNTLLNKNQLNHFSLSLREHKRYRTQAGVQILFLREVFTKTAPTFLPSSV